MESILEQRFAQADAAVLVVDFEHRVLAWNPRAERTLGWSATEDLGHGVSELLAPEDSPFRRYVGAALLGDVLHGGRRPRPHTPHTAHRQQNVRAGLAQRTRELQRIIGAFPDLFFWADSTGRVLDYFAGTRTDSRRPLHEILGHSIPIESSPSSATSRISAGWSPMW